MKEFLGVMTVFSFHREATAGLAALDLPVIFTCDHNFLFHVHCFHVQCSDAVIRMRGRTVDIQSQCAIATENYASQRKQLSSGSSSMIGIIYCAQVTWETVRPQNQQLAVQC